MIKLQNVTKSYAAQLRPAVQDLNLEIADGEFLVLLGSSGCGKTTTLKMINRLIEPTSGHIEIDGQNVLDRNVQKLRRSIGYVFQGIGLFPHLNIEDNVGIVLRLMGRDRCEIRDRVRELLSLVELDPETFGRALPKQLSGGQQQRAGVARALAADPDYLLMDEPFGALDALTRDVLQMELLRIKQDLAKTIVFVTHDLFEALTLADRIAVMHEGRLEQIDTTANILARPATPFVRELFDRPAKQLNILSEHQP